MKTKKKIIQKISLIIVLLTTYFVWHNQVESSGVGPLQLSDLSTGDLVTYSGMEWIVLAPTEGLIVTREPQTDSYYYNGSLANMHNTFDPNNSLMIPYWLNNTFYTQLENTNWIKEYNWNGVNAKVGLLSKVDVETYEQALRFQPTNRYYTRTPYSTDQIYVYSSLFGNFTIDITYVRSGPTYHTAPAIYIDPSLFVVNNELFSCYAPNIELQSSDSEGVWKGEDVIVTLEGGQCQDGIGNRQYRIHDVDGWSQWREYEGTLEFIENGEYIIESRMSGLKSSVNQALIKVDKTIPDIPTISLPSEEWYIGPVEVQLEPGSNIGISGLDRIEYRIDNNDWLIYSTSLHIEKEGLTTISARVINQSGNISEIVTRDIKIASSNADLSDLVLSSGTLSTAFHKDITSYTVDVGNDVNSLKVTPMLDDANASLEVNGSNIVSGSESEPIYLDVGGNVITIQVTAQDGTTKKYTIMVHREANVNLSFLELSSGTLSPTFDATITNYSSNIGNEVDSLTVISTLADINGSVKVNGNSVESGIESETINLDVGANVISIVVTGEDGITTKTYTITVTREASSNANLSNFEISSGTLSPVFEGSTKTYTVSVENSVSVMTVTPTLEDFNAKVKVNHVEVLSGEESEEIYLIEGENIIQIEAIAEDGVTTKTYEITVTRANRASGGGGGNFTPVEPTQPNRSSITLSITREGNIISFEGAEIEILEGAVDQEINLTIVKLTEIEEQWKTDNKEIVSDIFGFTKTQDGNFNKPVTITLPFNRSRVDFSLQRVSIFWFNEDTNEWVELENVNVNLKDGKVSGQVDHFTKFSVLAVDQYSINDVVGHWAENNIRLLLGLNSISGYPDGSFKPINQISRAEFTSIVVRALGLGSTGNKEFTDTSNHWAKVEIATAYEYGIIEGYNHTTFGANDAITREQMAAIVVNAFELQKGNEKTFLDSKEISFWAKEAIQLSSSNGILTGYPDDTFKPMNYATRAEAVTVIVRAIRNRIE